MSERMKLLEAVVDAARIWAAPLREATHSWPTQVQKLLDTLAALDAVDAQPQGENVTLAVWQGPHGNAVLAVPGTVADRDDDRPWTRLGTVMLPLNPEIGA